MKNINIMKSFFLIPLLVVMNQSILLADDPNGVNPVPLARQIEWQSREFELFFHFGINTFYNAEWGTGAEDPARFNPTAFDARQWISVAKNTGAKGVVLVAKHHDGFCVWPSAFTTHDIASSSFKGGSGDIVMEVANACSTAGLKFGVYLSPWDMHESTYGKGKTYNDFYMNQVRELAGGKYGKIWQWWMDGAGDTTQHYDWPGYCNLVHQLQPDCIIFAPPPAAKFMDCRWVGNEAGQTGDTIWSAVRLADSNSTQEVFCKGNETGDRWSSPQTDVSIRPGWFFHSSENNQVQSIAHLIQFYCNAVGRNSELLLNVPPDTRGLIHDSDIVHLKGLRNWIDSTFSVDLATGAAVTATNYRTGHDPAFVIDNETQTYWTTDNAVSTASLTLDLGTNKKFDVVVLQEHIALGQRVKGFSIEVYNGSTWSQITAGGTIGYKRIVRLSAPVNGSKVRLNIKKLRSGVTQCPTISSLQIFKQGTAPIDTTRPDPTKNLACSQKTTASDSVSGSGPALVADCDMSTKWATAASVRNAFIEVDLLGQHWINKTIIKESGQNIKKYRIQYFDGMGYRDLVNNYYPASAQLDSFTAISTNKIKLIIDSTVTTAGISLYEFEIYFTGENTDLIRKNCNQQSRIINELEILSVKIGNTQTVKFSVPAKSNCVLELFNSRGQKIQAMNVLCDIMGCKDICLKKPVPAGVYYCSVRSQKYYESKKVFLVR